MNIAAETQWWVPSHGIKPELMWDLTMDKSGPARKKTNHPQPEGCTEEVLSQ